MILARPPRVSLSIALGLLLGSLLTCHALAKERMLTPAWDYTQAMKKVASQFEGNAGVVIHVGDSITYSNPYGQWARYGKGRTAEDLAVLRWMHQGKDDESDGWWLARADHPLGGRSYTACSGLQIDQLLAGGRRSLPSLSEMLAKYKPQMVVFMLGTNDIAARRPVASFRADLEKALELILGAHAIPIVSTVPPFPGREAESTQYNQTIREVARSKKLPLIDFEQEILRRRPKDWNGTLLGKNDVHPTSKLGEATAASPPTAENLRNSGYLLRGWLTVQKVAEVKQTVLADKLLLVGESKLLLSVSETASTTSHPTGKTTVLQGRSVVRDALIDYRTPDKSLGGQSQSNALVRLDRTNAFLIRFDLEKLERPVGGKLGKAVVSFFVWDPSSSGNTKVSAFPLRQAWEEESVNWEQPFANKHWTEQSFTILRDTGPATAHAVVKPDAGSDIAKPPIEYRLDVTPLVRSWLAGGPNHGLAIAPVADRKVDDGLQSRFQIFASEHRQKKVTPKLTLEWSGGK